MEYSIRPQDHELREARNTVQGALEASKAVLPKEENIEVSLGWEDSDFIQEVDGATGRCHSPRKIELYFNSEISGWKKSLKSTTAHEFAHAWFHEQKETDFENLMFVWQQVLMDAHAQLFAEKITDYIDPVSKTASKEEIKNNWDEIREQMSKEFGEAEDIFYGNGDYPRWLGYTVAYRIGEKLLEEHDLEEFPELKRSDVLEAGDALFN
ncbi:MAG: DUF2268 domain-containing putative Zn-dependent protease [Candidatus Nanohalobium sp.]